MELALVLKLSKGHTVDLGLTHTKFQSLRGDHKFPWYSFLVDLTRGPTMNIFPAQIIGWRGPEFQLSIKFEIE